MPVTTKPRGSVNIDLSLGLVFAVLGLIGIVLAVLLKETDENYWDNIGVLWSLAAIAAAVLMLVPSLRSVVNLDEKLSWRIGAAGAAFLVFWWVVLLAATAALLLHSITSTGAVLLAIAIGSLVWQRGALASI